MNPAGRNISCSVLRKAKPGLPFLRAYLLN
jgi:hypothetical protein